MSNFELLNKSCADLEVDAIVNAANGGLWEGVGICGVIFKKAGSIELAKECAKHKTPVKDGEAVITSACKIKNAKAIIHAVGPDFRNTPKAFLELFNAYYNSMCVLKDNGLHSISFPLISAGVFAGATPHPAAESAKQCMRAYKKFIADYTDYDIDVKLCAYSDWEYKEASEVYKEIMNK